MQAPTAALGAGFQLPAQPAGALGPSANEPTLRIANPVRQGFAIGALRLMVQLQDGSELTEMPAVFALPNAPAWMLGMTNLHGSLVPVFDLARWMAVTHDPQARPMLLVLGHGAQATGLVIDGLPRRVRLAAGQEVDAATAPPQLAGAVRGAHLIDDQLYFDLDCDALFQLLERPLDGTG